MDEATRDLGRRLARLRKELGLDVEGMSQRTGIPVSTLKKYEAGLRAPGSRALQALSGTGVDLNWLLTGEGAPFPGEGADGRYALIPRYDVAASAGGGAVVADEGIVEHLAFDRAWLRRELGADPRDLYLIEVQGESMEPTLRPGDLILVDHRQGLQVPADGIYVLRKEKTLLVKRLQRLPGRRLRVSSDNPAYEPFELTLDDPGEAPVVIGRVVWVARRL